MSCHDLGKAHRRIRCVLRSFGLKSLRGARVLDVGCGLGFFSGAMCELGARVRALDTSAVAIERVRETFPSVEPAVGRFPDDCPLDEKYDFIWTNDFPMLNTFDVRFISREFVRPACARLREGGSLVIGTHTNFDGTRGSSNWANWPLPMIEELKAQTGLTGPRVAMIPSRWAGNGLILLGRVLRMRVPIALHRVR